MGYPLSVRSFVFPLSRYPPFDSLQTTLHSRLSPALPSAAFASLLDFFTLLPFGQRHRPSLLPSVHLLLNTGLTSRLHLPSQICLSFPNTNTFPLSSNHCIRTHIHPHDHHELFSTASCRPVSLLSFAASAFMSHLFFFPSYINDRNHQGCHRPHQPQSSYLHLNPFITSLLVLSFLPLSLCLFFLCVCLL